MLNTVWSLITSHIRHVYSVSLVQIHETIESINQLKTQRDFMLSFSNHPQDFIQDWLKSQSRDLKVRPPSDPKADEASSRINVINESGV